MSANPLLVISKSSHSKSLESHCHWLNGLNWVQASGNPYFIAERTKPDGSIERYLGRGA